MQRRVVIFKAALVLIVVWSAVWGIRVYAESMKVTAEKVAEKMDDSTFADLSALAETPAALAQARENKIREIADGINRLDFTERQSSHRDATSDAFFNRLSTREKTLFLDLTVVQSMTKFMTALDAMPPEQRKKFIEQGVKEIENGQTAEDMKRAKSLGGDVLDRIARGGMKAYFQNASPQTKMDLFPLMQAMNEVMQGLRGNEFNLPR